MRPTVSVVVPTKNRPAEAARMLASLCAQPTQPLEVVVIDQSPIAYDLEPFPQLRHVHAPHIAGLTAARNAGIELVQGDVVLFFDDDVVLLSDCVAAVAAFFERRPDVVGAQCSVHNPWDDAPFTLYDLSTYVFEHGFFNSRPLRRGNEQIPRLIDGLASAYRRCLFAHERFDEALPDRFLAEDWDFTKRAARHGNLAIIADARVEHLHSSLNRPDPYAYARARWRNILYLYEKMEAGRDVRNRLFRWWWMFGESLRSLRLARRG